MSKFPGFSEKQYSQTNIPEIFFQEILPDIDHLGELKLTLYIFWRFSRMEAAFKFLTRRQIIEDQRFMKSLGNSPAEAQTFLDDSVESAVARGTFLEAVLEMETGIETLFFLNSPKGLAAVEAIGRGQWHAGGEISQPQDILPAAPNIFQLYEDNIGPLTPMIAEAIGDAQDTYPNNWIEEAIQIAAENNKRSWKYIEAILKRWHQEGKHERRDQEDPEKSRTKYIEGDYSEFIEH